MPIAIKINPKDNVVVALHPIAKGTAVPVDNTTVTAIEDIPQGHKMAIAPIKSWVLEFYNEHKSDDVPTLVHAVMTNEQMWGQDLTKVPGFEEATVKNLTNIRENGALAAYASCL